MAGVQFDAAKFNWLGAIAPTDETVAVWHTAGIATFDGARSKDIVTGATARGSITYTFPALLNELFGSRFKLVTGYNGGTEINLAMERGEVEARNNTWSSWKATEPAWLQQATRSRSSCNRGRAPGRPRRAYCGSDLAKNPDDPPPHSRSGVVRRRAWPAARHDADVPPERVAALRAAFDETMKDPEFLAEAGRRLNFDVDPIRGVDMQKTVERILVAPPDVCVAPSIFWNKSKRPYRHASMEMVLRYLAPMMRQSPLASPPTTTTLISFFGKMRIGSSGLALSHVAIGSWPNVAHG